MANQIYTQASISEAGYKLMDRMLRPWQDKVVATLVPIKGGKKVNAYLDRKLIPEPFPKEPYPLPEDYVISKIPNEKDGYFIIGKPRKSKKKDVQTVEKPAIEQSSKVDEVNALPITIGNQIHLKSKLGTYKVAFVTRDIILITTQAWAKEFIRGERIVPTELVLWSDFKCKEGESNES